MRATSYRSPKVKVNRSGIEGRGLFAVEPIRKGEVVTVKGGHIIDGKTLKQNEKIIGASLLQIADDLYIAPLEAAEVDRVMMFLNHSCEPNVGVQGNVIFVAMRDIELGEELTIDYAMIDDIENERLECHCGRKDCRKVITGKDWQRRDLQKKYGRFFSSYLLKKWS